MIPLKLFNNLLLILLLTFLLEVGFFELGILILKHLHLQLELLNDELLLANGYLLILILVARMLSEFFSGEVLITLAACDLDMFTIVFEMVVELLESAEFQVALLTPSVGFACVLQMLRQLGIRQLHSLISFRFFFILTSVIE